MEPETKRDLTPIGAVWAQSATEDLSGLVGASVVLAGPRIEDGDLRTIIGNSGAVVCTSCVTQDDSKTTLGIAAPLRAAQMLAALQLEKSADDFKDFQAAPFKDAGESAYAQIMDLCVGILGRVLEEEAALPALKLGETETLEAGQEGTVIASGTYRCARFTLQSPGFPNEQIDLLFPSEIAVQWFGPFVKTEQAAREKPGQTSVVAGPIAVLDRCTESRDLVASFAAPLELDVVTMDPDEFGDDMLDELSKVGAIVIDWDLGGRSGLDVLERLRADLRTRDVPVVMASPNPTQAMVEAALRWGAHTFLFKPYDVNEISERLLGRQPLPEAAD